MKHIFLFLVMLIAAHTIYAVNPIVQTHFTPDPAPMVHNNRVYVYTGDDIPGSGFYYMTKWRVCSSSDMVNWTDHGVPLTLESFSWALDRAWASQCIERNGKFYWYICVQTVQNNMAVGVAVGDSPTGSFKDAIGKPLVTTGSWSNIDPTVFVDDDGQAYLYWGNSSLYYVKLNKDMVSYSGEVMEVPQSVKAFGGVRGDRRKGQVAGAPENKDMFVEAPWFYKRNGIYYQMYAGMDKGRECLSYSTSDSPVGPWEYRGRIMVDEPTNSFTNHGGIIDFKGKSYLFYHTALLPDGGSYSRSAAVEQFDYNPDGSIPLIHISKQGPAAVGVLNPYDRVEAETMCRGVKCTTSQFKSNVFVTGIRTGGYVQLSNVDFGITSPTEFSATLAAGLDGGILEARIDSIGGSLLSTIQVKRTGGWDKWKTINVPVTQSVTGVHDLYFVFKGQNLTAGRELFNFDYWCFNK